MNNGLLPSRFAGESLPGLGALKRRAETADDRVAALTAHAQPAQVSLDELNRAATAMTDAIADFRLTINPALKSLMKDAAAQIMAEVSQYLRTEPVFAELLSQPLTQHQTPGRADGPGYRYDLDAMKRDDLIGGGPLADDDAPVRVWADGCLLYDSAIPNGVYDDLENRRRVRVVNGLVKKLFDAGDLPQAERLWSLMPALPDSRE